MKSRNIKTRLAAFGLALLMGLSPLGNLADVHAAEREISQKAVTEKKVRQNRSIRCRKFLSRQ